MRAQWRRAAVPEAVPELRAAVTAFASGAGVLDPPMADVRLAVTEAVTNVVLHGYRDVPEPGMVEIVATHSADELRVSVLDRGQGAAPRSDSPGLGQGLALMAKISDRFELRDRVPVGTEVRMTFALASPPGA